MTIHDERSRCQWWRHPYSFYTQTMTYHWDLIEKSITTGYERYQSKKYST